MTQRDRGVADWPVTRDEIGRSEEEEEGNILGCGKEGKSRGMASGAQVIVVANGASFANHRFPLNPL